MQGKIIKGIGGFYYVHDGKASVWECKAKGVFRSRGQKPLVGDQVEFTVIDEEAGTGRIDELMPRSNELIRPAVANIDQALILVSARTPAFHPVLLDHFLLWMASQHIPAIVGIGKIDLDPEEKWKEIEEIYRGAGCRLCAFSAVTGEGLDALRELLAGRTTVLAGASGVGKSTLLNALVPDAAMETGELSRKLERGRHTTRHSEFFFLTENTFVLDTPGFTSLAAPEMEAEEVRQFYPEFAEWEGSCRFADCAHLKETDCAVKKAVEAGSIPQSRYQGYIQIMDEIRSRRKY